MNDTPAPKIAPAVSPPPAAPSFVMTSLRTKLARLILVQLLVVVGVGAGATVVLRVGEFRESLARSQSQLRQALTDKGQLLTLNQSIAFRAFIDDNALSDMCALISGTVRADVDVAYGLATDIHGKLLAFAAKPDLDAALPSGDAVSAADTPRVLAALDANDFVIHGMRELKLWNRTMVEFSVALRDEQGAVEGILRYGLSTRQMDFTLAEARARHATALWWGVGGTTLLSVAVLVLGLWLSLRESRRVTQPINALTEAASRLAGGTRDIRVNIQSGDELQVLGDVFNQMVADLAASYADLEQTNRKLSDEISVRVRSEEQRRLAEAQLAQAQKMEAVGQLAGGVAHDFNNLLTVIQGHSSLLSMLLDARPHLEGAIGVREHLGKIDLASTRAANLTRQLLSFSRRDRDNPIVISPRDVVSGIESMLRRLLRENIRFDCQFAPDTPRVQIDPGRLEQVVMNLAINAGDAMPAGGVLRIGTERVEIKTTQILYQSELPPGIYCLLSVSDTGEGVAPEHMGHVFEPFFTTKPVGKGTGLGLATVHGIVRRANAHVDLTSVVGQGTTFRIYFPIAEPHERVAATTQVDALPRGEGQRIMVCEDDPAVRRVTESFLSLQGYAVSSFAGPNEALAYARSQTDPIDLLVTDVVMPDMSGPELAIAIGKVLPGLRVLFVSGYTGGALEHYGLGDGAEPLLHKPFTRYELCHAVAKVLQVPRLADTA